MAPSDHDRRTDGPLQDIEDLLADARSGDENSQGADDPGQQLNAIRGQGGTATNPLQDVNNALGQSARPPPGSQVGTEASQMTIRDRGDAQYDEACSTGLHKPDVKTPSLPPHCPLSDRLMSLRVTSRPPKGPYFYPKGSVEALMTAKEIESIIRQGRQRLEGAGKRLTDEEIRNYAGRACHEQLDGGADSSYRVTFAILVLLDRGWDIVFFIDGGICDKHLPLKAVPVNGRGSGLLSEIRLENDPNTRLSCLDHWLAVNHDDFERKQWDMLAPFFSRGERRNAWLYELPEKVVLPWTEENNAARQGGYGLVSKVKIHPNHHTFNLTKANGGWFAVKQFKGSESSNGTSDTSGSFDRREFENEIEILRRFSGDVHPHLISLQAAFRHGDEYSVIMPWADCDLAEFWEETKPGSPLDRNNLLWMLEQCRGLAGGLQSIHLYKRTESATATNDPWPEKIFGRHGDIKPPNILLFRDQSNPEDKGKLVITDFGLSRFHSDGSKSLSTIHCTATPLAPSRYISFWTLLCRTCC
ncbi:kinase-like domain-containing protein [Chaetomium fimeti]|uniref:Kinase-like domain-containing protein n=1 Tax=Chaetomium fimeti TaxID=1854472 RepID=A0AAE0HER9_9PEZI|nr:kinase-like domain-containing protein [Chaetomium fimeti]